MRDPAPMPASYSVSDSKQTPGVLHRPITVPSPAPIFRATGVFGKDLIHHAKVVVTMLLASCFAVYLPWLGGLLTNRNSEMSMHVITSNASSIYLALLITCAFVFGLVLSADEVENRTISLLDVLPCSRMSHFAHKFTAGAVMLAVWAFGAAILMGWLSENGFALLRSLLHDRVQLFSIAFGFHSSGAIIFLQCISLLVTGLVSGFLFQNLAPSAIVGILAYCIFLAVTGHLFVQKQFAPGTTGLINSASLVIWTGLMIVAYPRMFRRAHSLRGDPAFRLEAASPRWKSITRFLQYRRTRVTKIPFDPPHRYLLRLPVALLCIVSFAFLALLAGPQLNPYPVAWMTFVFGVPACIALAGTGIWLPEERVAPRFAIYTLPVSRSRLFWPRIGSLLISAFAIVASIFIGFFIAVIRDALNSGGDALETFPFEMLFFLTGIITSLICLGAMFRLFYRSRLIATVFAAMVVFPWAVMGANNWGAFARSIGYQSPPQIGSRWMGTGPLLYAAWIILVVVGLPILVSYLGFCRTRLLETSERTRGSISLVVFVALIVWGSFLIGIVPSQLYTILFVH